MFSEDLPLFCGIIYNGFFYSVSDAQISLLKRKAVRNMICEKCGRENSPESKFCIGCGSPFHEEEPALPVNFSEEADAETEASIKADAPEAKLRSYMAAAVLTTVFLGNWIFGIPAIVFARECEKAAEAGQTEIARRFSRRALTFLAVGSALSVALISFLALIFVMARNLVLIY